MAELIACKDASLFHGFLCSWRPPSMFYKLLEIERGLPVGVVRDRLPLVKNCFEYFDHSRYRHWLIRQSICLWGACLQWSSPHREHYHRVVSHAPCCGS